MALLYEISSVNSLVQVWLALLEACDQFLIVAATSTLYVSSGRASLDGQSYVLARTCLSPPTLVSLGSCTSNFHCHLDA